MAGVAVKEGVVAMAEIQLQHYLQWVEGLQEEVAERARERVWARGVVLLQRSGARWGVGNEGRTIS